MKLLTPQTGTLVTFGRATPKPKDYAELEKMVNAGDLKPIVKEKYRLADAAQAFKRLEEGGTVGKIVVSVS